MAKRRRRRSRQRLGSEIGSVVALFGFLAYFYPEAFETLFGLLVLCVFLFLVGLGVWGFLKLRRRINPTELQKRFSSVKNMSGREFERFTADLFTALGYKARVTGGTGDQGVDVIAVKGESRVAVQCKNHKSAVGNKPVQEVYAGAVHHGCTDSVVLAPGGFTRGAVELSKSVGVRLLDSRGIQRHIDKARQLQKAEPRSEPLVVSPVSKTSEVRKAGPAWDKWTRK